MRPWLFALVLACSLDGPHPTENRQTHQERPEDVSRTPDDVASDPHQRNEGILARVTRVTDGDTIRVEFAGRQERVRYIGIDTPETRHSPRGPQPFGAEASEANRRLVAGRQVRLIFDVDERDRYGRLLAYVYLPDGTFINAKLVNEGYARVLTVPPNVRHADEFRTLETRARQARRGLWALNDSR